jgi:hypothetical protein
VPTGGFSLSLLQECKQRNKGMREQVDGIRKQSNGKRFAAGVVLPVA